MSLRAKIEAVIYAAEEPVTLAQLAAIFANELEPAADAEASTESAIENGLIYANFESASESAMLEMASLDPAQEKDASSSIPEPSNAEADEKRAARQRDRQVREQLKKIVDGLVEEYAKSDRGMEIREVAGGYRVATKPEYHDAVRAFIKSLKPPMKLSLQALETLAVIAYKQPVTAPEVSEIRGVDSGGVLGSLIGRKLITTAGRKQVIGRPILYKTTREFLLRFGLKDLNELPSIEEFEKLAGDIEIGDEDGSAQEETLPFETEPDAVEANAGEAGVAVEPAAEPTSEVAQEATPQTVPLDADVNTAETPASTNDSIEVTPASHPSVPIAEEIEEDHGRS